MLKRLLICLAVGLALPLAAWGAGQVVTGTVSFNANFVEQKTSGVLATQNISVPIVASVPYTNGTGANQVDTIFGTKYTLTASTPVTINLQSATDPAGNTVAFARVREFVVQVTDTTAAHTITVYRAASNGWSVLPASTNAVPVQANNGIFYLNDPKSTGSGNGNVVTAGSCQFVIDPGSNTVTSVSVLAAGCQSP
jgi:hypothetical protein